MVHDPGDEHHLITSARDLAAHRAAEELKWRAKCERLRSALRAISKGGGPYSQDPLTHAHNCVEHMKEIAINALEHDS